MHLPSSRTQVGGSHHAAISGRGLLAGLAWRYRPASSHTLSGHPSRVIATHDPAHTYLPLSVRTPFLFQARTRQILVRGGQLERGLEGSLQTILV